MKQPKTIERDRKSVALKFDSFYPDTGTKKELQHWVRQLWSWWILEVQHSKKLEKENQELKLLCKLKQYEN